MLILEKMYKEQFIKKISEKLDKLEKTLIAKNSDYSKSGWFENFELVEKLWITTAEKWILVRICDKISRISNLINQENQVKDETIQDTLEDLANYSILLSIYLDNKDQK